MNEFMKTISDDELEILLIDKLRSIRDNNDFIYSVMLYVDTRDKRLELLNFIENGEDVNYETVTVLAIDLSDE